ncbi:hypothetical protein ACFVGY_01175 [Streptomyces sp. NPDC127106]|uniref:hypothetical protein n=1 Tax=Streptomyces sp. NPDC127106 TaxID=3345360 RepID=UPI0036394061
MKNQRAAARREGRGSLSEGCRESQLPRPRRSRAEKWADRLAAARQFHAREQHLRVPRKHVERFDALGMPWSSSA